MKVLAEMLLQSPAALLGWARARLEQRREGIELRDERAFRQFPDRIILKHSILPGVAETARDILWIGCQSYTRDCPAMLEVKGATCWTLDIEPATARYGHPTRHVVGDLRRLEGHFAQGAFDAILCNGVLGWGVDSPQAQAEAAAQMVRGLRPGGLLVLGWNSNRMPDPAPLFPPHLVAMGMFGLDPRVTIPGSTHVYDFYRDTREMIAG